MISWTGQSLLSSSPRVNISNQTNDGVVYTRTVTFSPLLNGDGGQYTCSVSVGGFDEANISSNVIVNGKCYTHEHNMLKCQYNKLLCTYMYFLN